MNLEQKKTYNQVYAPILVGITIFLMIVAFRPMYTSYLSKETQLASVEKALFEKQASLDKLVAIQKSFATGSGSTEIIEKVKKLNQPFDTTNIMATVMLNDFTRPGTIGGPKINISTISVDKGHALPIGLSLGNVSLAVSALSVEDMVDFITYLTQSSNFAFTIDSITLPIDTTSSAALHGGVSLNLSMGVYYYE